MKAGGVAIGRVGWYARRLRSMRPREVLWRVRMATLRPVSTFQAGFNERQWADSLDGFRVSAERPVLLDPRRAVTLSESEPDLIPPLLKAADLVVDQVFQFFGYPPVALPRPLNWHYDPISGTVWPDDSSNRIDHRTAGGDAKWIWELNRLQHLTLLAQGWLFTGDQRYSRTAFEHLDSWLDQNPPGRGIAWRGAFEAGLRSISITLALQGLRNSPDLTVDRYRRIVEVLAVSAERCWRERSLFSSANNHLIGEMAGLAVIGMFFPDLPGADNWERHAVQTLSAEAGKLILPDGCGAEQSVGYQIATAELLHLVAVLLLQRDGQAPSVIIEAISRSSRLLADVVGDNDPDPRYGDADQEFAIRLGPEDRRTVRQHLGITSAVGLGAGNPNQHEPTLAAEWYRRAVPPAVSAVPPAGQEAVSVPDAFFSECGGLVVLRRGRRRITMDVGPLGYLSIAAHGHADALAVTLSDGGQDIIGDPGTGSYYQHPRWREVMRGTRAHPTVCIDGQDQSVIGGPFMWTRHARTRVRAVDLAAGVVDAEHDGYKRLPGSVIHRRWLIAPPEERTHLVVDLVTGSGVHQVRTTWPLHPSLSAVRGDLRHLVTRDGEPILEVLHASNRSVSLEESHGDGEECLGWWSDVLESRTPSWWLSAVCCAELPAAIVTLLCPADGMLAEGLEATLTDGTIEVTWSEDASLQRRMIRIDTSAGVSNRPYHDSLQSEE